MFELEIGTEISIVDRIRASEVSCPCRPHLGRAERCSPVPCQECAENEVGGATGVCSACPPGTEQAGAGDDCSTCPPGVVSTDGTCIPCPAGAIPNDGRTECSTVSEEVDATNVAKGWVGAVLGILVTLIGSTLLLLLLRFVKRKASKEFEEFKEASRRSKEFGENANRRWPWTPLFEPSATGDVNVAGRRESERLHAVSPVF